METDDSIQKKTKKLKELASESERLEREITEIKPKIKKLQKDLVKDIVNL
jgi:peptidoglycan hydrolase CwlO-like protein